MHSFPTYIPGKLFHMHLICIPSRHHMVWEYAIKGIGKFSIYVFRHGDTNCKKIIHHSYNLVKLQLYCHSKSNVIIASKCFQNHFGLVSIWGFYFQVKGLNHHKNKTITRVSYLYNGCSYTGETYLYCIGKYPLITPLLLHEWILLKLVELNYSACQEFLCIRTSITDICQ